MMYRVVAAAIAVVSVWASMAAAQSSSQLQQSVEPIVCVFTSTETGTDVSGATVCDSADAPTISSISRSSVGRPILSGKLSMMSFQRFRVWIGSQWFTYGISPQLQTSGTMWQLDLSDSDDRLAPGEYTVVVELLTNDDYLLRSVYTDVFVVPVVTVTDTITNVSPGVVTHERDVSHSDQPLGSGQTLPPYQQNDGLESTELLPENQIALAKPSMDDTKKEEQLAPALVVAAAGLGAAGVVGFAVRRIVTLPRNNR